ncbi:uncharacterized protein LOC142591415 [Dermacentor variabilis]|uniref:uncharacterized protein LOC142591415 n=1 Tax=Dermacentor variabilis TaxID=34621 RepID=UPI003F5BFFA4
MSQVPPRAPGAKPPSDTPGPSADGSRTPGDVEDVPSVATRQLASVSESPLFSSGKKSVRAGVAPSRNRSMSIMPTARDQANPALMHARMVLQKLQDAHKEKQQQQQLAKFEKKQKREKALQASEPASFLPSRAGSAEDLGVTTPMSQGERERRLSYVPLPEAEPSTSERWVVMLLSLFLLIISVALFVVLFGLFAQSAGEQQIGKQSAVGCHKRRVMP